MKKPDGVAGASYVVYYFSKLNGLFLDEAYLVHMIFRLKDSARENMLSLTSWNNNSRVYDVIVLWFSHHYSSWMLWAIASY